MTRRAKLLIAAAVLAGFGAVAIPTLAAQIGTPGAGVQTAFGGPDGGRDGGFGHHRMRGDGHGGPGGPGFGRGGPGRMGFGPQGGHGPQALLDKFDTDKDGKIAKTEIDAAQADQLKKYDKDADGTLSLSEYQALFADETHEPMVRAFQRFDRDGDSKVTADELNGHVDRIVQHLDRNNDGVIDQSELAGPRMGPGGRGPGDRNGPPPPAEQPNNG